MKFEYISTINEAVETHVRLNQIFGSLKKEFLVIAIIAPVVFFSFLCFPKEAFKQELGLPLFLQ